VRSLTTNDVLRPSRTPSPSLASLQPRFAVVPSSDSATFIRMGPTAATEHINTRFGTMRDTLCELHDPAFMSDGPTPYRTGRPEQ
jgi:hypothetical protein